jgi:hypothetical protein
VLVGRSVELGRLVDLLAPDGPARLVLEGPAGIGKTTLWEEGVRLARSRGWTVLASRPRAAEQDLAFMGLADLLRGPTAAAALRGVSAPRRHALEVALALTDPGPVPPDPLALGLGLLDVLTEVAGAAPVLVAVDDVQWWDPASARVAGFALHRTDVRRIRLLLGRRTPSAPAGTGTDPDGRRDLEPWPVADAVRCALGPMSLGALRALLEARLGVSWSRAQVSRVHEASGGNPFLALEVAATLHRRGVAPDPVEPLPPPRDPSAAVATRLAELSPAAADAVLVVATAARADRDVMDAAVAQLAAQDGSATAATGPATAAAAVAEAVAAGALTVSGDAVWCAHPLVAAAARDRAAPSRRRSVHAVLATLAPTEEERVRHAALALPGRDPGVAERLAATARAVRARGAHAAAVDLAELALRLGDRTTPTPAAGSSPSSPSCSWGSGTRPAPGRPPSTRWPCCRPAPPGCPSCGCSARWSCTPTTGRRPTAGWSEGSPRRGRTLSCGPDCTRRWPGPAPSTRPTRTSTPPRRWRCSPVVSATTRARPHWPWRSSRSTG